MKIFKEKTQIKKYRYQNFVQKKYLKTIKINYKMMKEILIKKINIKRNIKYIQNKLYLKKMNLIFTYLKK